MSYPRILSKNRSFYKYYYEQIVINIIMSSPRILIKNRSYLKYALPNIYDVF